MALNQNAGAVRTDTPIIAAVGEIMLRLSPRDPGSRVINSDTFLVEPGGSESNVAVALSLLGNRCRFITKLPNHVLSDKITRYLRGYGVDTSHICFGGKRLGMYWTEIGSGPRPHSVHYDRENSSFSEIDLPDVDFEASLHGVSWIHTSGITPAVSKAACDFILHALGHVYESMHISIDLNFRSKLWLWAKKSKQTIHDTLWAMCAKAVLICGNETDFTDCLGFPPAAGADGYRKAAEGCFERLPNLKYVAVSLRDSISASHNKWSGLLFVKNDRAVQAFEGTTYDLHPVIDRVGVGDSFVAGIIHGIHHYPDDPKKILDFAVALSALNHTVRGDASQFSVQEVENVMSNPSGKIIR